MCNFASAILTKDKVFFGWDKDQTKMDSHESIIKIHKLHEGTGRINFVRVELKPLNLNDPIKNWKFVVDQDKLPDWFDRIEAEARTRSAVKNSGLVEALAEYEKICDSASAEYERICTLAWAEYNRTYDSALAEYNRTCDSAFAEFNKICDSAWTEYKKICAPALAEYLVKRQEIAKKKW